MAFVAMTNRKTESIVLKSCMEDVQRFIVINVNDFSLFLYQKDVLYQTDYNNYTDPQTKLTKEQIAGQIFRKLYEIVEFDVGFYTTLMDHLRSVKHFTYKKIVSTLDGKYAELDSDPSPPGPCKEGMYE